MPRRTGREEVEAAEDEDQTEPEGQDEAAACDDGPEGERGSAVAAAGGTGGGQAHRATGPPAPAMACSSVAVPAASRARCPAGATSRTSSWSVSKPPNCRLSRRAATSMTSPCARLVARSSRPKAMPSRTSRPRRSTSDVWPPAAARTRPTVRPRMPTRASGSPGAMGPRGHPVRAADILGPQASHQPVLGIVGDGDRLFLGLEADHAHDRPENLLPRDPHAVVHVGKHGGRDVIAIAHLNEALAAGDQPRALVPADIEVAHGLFQLLAVRPAAPSVWKDRGRCRCAPWSRGQRARSRPCRRCCHAPEAGSRARSWPQSAKALRAVLSALGQIGVGQNDMRGLAAAFERKPLQVHGRTAHDLLRRAMLAGERVFVHVRMGDRRAPAMAPWPGTMLITPAGTPASAASLASSKAVIGVCSATLITAVQPVASAGASFHITVCSGAFHGVIMPTTPTGSREV